MNFALRGTTPFKDIKVKFPTNNNALNRRAGGRYVLLLYILLELLEREARLTTVTIRLVSEKKK